MAMQITMEDSSQVCLFSVKPALVVGAGVSWRPSGWSVGLAQLHSPFWVLRAQSKRCVIKRLVSVCKLISAPLLCIPASFCCTRTGFLSWKWFLASDKNLFHKSLSHCRLCRLLTICSGNKLCCFQRPH